jgi:dTDP-4-dehydrorhamnose 3,5-epimerase
MRVPEIEGVHSVHRGVLVDERGSFTSWFDAEDLAVRTGHSYVMAEGTISVSSAGTIRGIHYTDVPPGRGKYVTCVQGSIFDVAVDLRTGSPTFGDWRGQMLNAPEGTAVFLAEGIGHAFQAVSAGAVVVYLYTTGFDASTYRAVHPLDPAIGIEWPVMGRPLLSAKDDEAPKLADARSLPAWKDCHG